MYACMYVQVVDRQRHRQHPELSVGQTHLQTFRLLCSLFTTLHE